MKDYTQHNEKMRKHIESFNTLEDSFSAYVVALVADARALLDSGATPELVHAALDKVQKEIPTAWAAITANTYSQDEAPAESLG